MTFPSFLKPNKENDRKRKKVFNKDAVKHRCIELLHKIKEENQEAYHKLHKEFRARFDTQNIKKQLIIGFQGQLIQELNKLQKSEDTPMPIKNLIPKIKKVVEAKPKKQEAAKKVETKEVKKEVKKHVAPAKKATKKVA